MTLAPWRSPLARALHRNRSRPDSRYLQLATTGTDGYPANRTVVFRGFLGDRLMVISDTRSDKIQQIAANPAAEACWYFAKTREQFRLQGELAVVTADEPAPLQDNRQRLWQQISDAARQQFTWPSPGQQLQKEAFVAPPPDPHTPPAHFCLVLLEPKRVDHLALRGDPQDRIIYTHQAPDHWHIQTVNP
jgi:pyridoxamine 5'-phosphate oxidase